MLLHLGFVLLVALGWILVLRWPRVAWIHLPAVVWGILVEAAGWICPLTPLENALRRRAGQTAYSGDFLDRYVVPLLYPEDLTRGMQIGLALVVVVVNGLAYGWLIARSRRGRGQ